MFALKALLCDPLWKAVFWEWMFIERCLSPQPVLQCVTDKWSFSAFNMQPHSWRSSKTLLFSVLLTKLNLKVRWGKLWLVCAATVKRVKETQRPFVLCFGLFCCTSECVPVIALWVWGLECHHLLQISASYHLPSVCPCVSSCQKMSRPCCCAVWRRRKDVHWIIVQEDRTSWCAKKKICWWIRGCLHKQEDSILQADSWTKKPIWLNITKLLYSMWFLKAFC